MRTRLSRRAFLAVLLAIVLGIGSAVAIAAATTSDPAEETDVGALGPDKATEVNNATDSGEPLTNPEEVVALKPPFEDDGPSAGVADVKRDVVEDLQQDRSIMAPATVPANLQALLSEIYAAAVLPDVVRETSDAMLAAAADPTYKPYVDNRFVVKEWQGVRVDGSTAFALFLGHDSYRDPGASEFSDDPVRQWQVELAKEAGRWKLVSQHSVKPGG